MDSIQPQCVYQRTIDIGNESTLVSPEGGCSLAPDVPPTAFSVFHLYPLTTSFALRGCRHPSHLAPKSVKPRTKAVISGKLGSELPKTVQLPFNKTKRRV